MHKHNLSLYLSPVLVNESVESHSVFPARGEIGYVYVGVPVDTKQQINPSATTNADLKTKAMLSA